MPATPPRCGSTAGGGRGFVVRLAREGVERATGWTPTQPLSGMRCITPGAFAAVQPLARGWGVEVGLTIDVLRSGRRVVEVPCDLHHRVTGTHLVQLPVAAVIAAGSWLGARALSPQHVVVGIGLGMAAAYTVGALLSAALLIGTSALGPSAASPSLGPATALPPYALGVHPSSGVVTAVKQVSA